MKCRCAWRYRTHLAFHTLSLVLKEEGEGRKGEKKGRRREEKRMGDRMRVSGLRLAETWGRS